MTPTTQPTRTARTARTTETMLRDIGFVLAMTQKVRDDMGKPTPPPASWTTCSGAARPWPANTYCCGG